MVFACIKFFSFPFYRNRREGLREFHENNWRRGEKNETNIKKFNWNFRWKINEALKAPVLSLKIFYLIHWKIKFISWKKRRFHKLNYEFLRVEFLKNFFRYHATKNIPENYAVKKNHIKIISIKFLTNVTTPSSINVT